MRKSSIFIISLIGCLTFISPRPVLLFAQGKEHQEVGGGQLEERKTHIVRKKTPIVEYFIAPDDVIEVFVWQNPDLSKDIIVGPDGTISYPLVGRIQAVDLTLSQLEDKIRERLSEYIKYPQVSIMLKKASGNKIIILGEIARPGIYTYTASINLIEAIALAGDFTEGAHADSIMVVRGNLTEKPEVKRINILKAITRGTTSTEIVLQPNDVIFVPKTFVANFNKFLSDLQPTISTALSIFSLKREVESLE